MRSRGLNDGAAFAAILGTIIAFVQLIVALLDWLSPLEASQQTTSQLSPQEAVQGSILLSGLASEVPLLVWLNTVLERLPSETWPILLGTMGIVCILIGIWLYIWIKESWDLDTYAGLCGGIAALYICVRFWSWWGIAWAIILVPVAFIICGMAVDTLLGAVFAGILIGGLVGCGLSLLYLAIPGPFIGEYVIVGCLTGALLGGLLGLARHMFGRR